MLLTLQDVALCVVIEHYSGPLGKVTLEASLKLRIHVHYTKSVPVTKPSPA